MKPAKKNKTKLQFPLPESMYEKAKRELKQMDDRTNFKALESHDCANRDFITRCINKSLYHDVWNKSTLDNQKKVV